MTGWTEVPDKSLKNHMSECPKCRTEWEQVQEIVQGLGTLPVSGIDPDIWDRLPKKVMEEVRTLPKPKLGIGRTVRDWLQDIIFPKKPVTSALGFAFSVLFVIGILVYVFGGPGKTNFPKSLSGGALVPISSVDSTGVLAWMESSEDYDLVTLVASLSPTELDEDLGELSLRTSFISSSGAEPELFIINSFNVQSFEVDPLEENGIGRFTEGELEWIYESL